MKIDIYCDESYPDVFSSTSTTANYLAIGGIWMPQKKRNEIKTQIHKLRSKHKIGGEFKWTKVSPSKLNFYIELIDFFFRAQEDLRFRVILVNKQFINLKKFHNNNAELGFYKFYYQLLTHWIETGNEYYIFCDFKKNRDKNQIKTMGRCLKFTNVFYSVRNIQAVHSNESVFIQLVDVLTGATAAKLNNRINTNSAKEKLVSFLESKLGQEIAPTNRDENKFNVFKIYPGHRW